MRIKKLVSIGCGVLLSQAVVFAQSGSAQVVDVAAGGELRVSLPKGDVVIHVWDRNQVSVVADGVDRNGLRVEKSGNTVEVTLGGRGGRWGDVEIEISVPRRFTLDIGTGGGDVAIQGDLEGLLEVSTSGGDIDFNDVQGEVRVTTHGGDVDGGDVSGDSDVRSHGGDISLGNVGGKLDVTTHGGDIELREVGGDLLAKTLGGDIDATRVGGRADLTTQGGDINLDSVAAEATLRTAGGDISMRTAEGSVTAQTAGGDVEFRSVRGWINAVTAGGDIEVELIPAGSQGSTLESRGGDVTLILPADARVTVEARVRIRGFWKGKEDDYGIDAEFATTQYDERDTEIIGTYQINGGGPVIQIETVNGMIRLLKSRQR